MLWFQKASREGQGQNISLQFSSLRREDPNLASLVAKVSQVLKLSRSSTVPSTPFAYFTVCKYKSLQFSFKCNAGAYLSWRPKSEESQGLVVSCRRNACAEE